MTGLKTVIAKFTAFALVSLLLGWILVNTMLHGVDGAKETYHAKFQDVSGLRVGDDIKVAGVRVGRVSGIEVAGTQALVDLQMSASQKIPSNSQLVMRYQNLVGQRYLSIQPPYTGAMLSPGQTIDASHTSSGFDLTELLNGFRPLFQVLQPKDVNTLATTIVQVLQGEGPTVASLLNQTAQLTTFVANRDTIISSVLTNLTPVLKDFSAHSADLHTTVVDLKDLMTGLANDRQQIGSAVSGIASLIGTTNGLLAQVRAPLAGTVKELRKAAEMLAGSRQNLVSAINGFNTGIGGLGRATSYENALNIYVCTLKVTLGSLPSLPLGGTSGAAVCK